MTGFSAPVVLHRVLEPVESPEDSSADLLPLVNREREMELLLSRWALAREGNGQVVLISGEAGIGKSRLVLGLRERLEGTAQWLSCFGSPYTQSSPLQPVVALLRQVLLQREGASPLDRLAEALADVGLAEAVPLFASLLDLPLDQRHPAPPLSPERQRERTLEALVALVVEIAERQPLVLLIEDLHWLDPTTLGRLDRLGTAKEVAQVAAVIGRVFSFELLAAVCSDDEATLQQELRRLVQAELVYRKGFGGQTRYLFKHALVQDAAYESLLKRERQQIHRQIAETLASRFPATAEATPEILAHHYTEANLPEPALDAWVSARSLASRPSARLEALPHLDRALRLLPSLPQRPERDRRELGIQNLRAPSIIAARGYTDPEVEQTYARAEVLADRLAEAEERFWALYGLYTHHVIFGNLPQALGLAERLLRIAESEERPGFLSVAWFTLGVYHFYHSDYAH